MKRTVSLWLVIGSLGLVLATASYAAETADKKPTPVAPAKEKKPNSSHFGES